jgi:hypothetical protein
MASYDPDRADPGLDLARQFYTAHELLMTRAAKEAKTEDRQFEFSGDLFDAWAVGAGHMPKRLSAAVDAVEARGLAHLRTSLRHKINRAARRGHGLPRGYSVEARAQKWKVLLQEHYLLRRPKEDADGIARVFDLVGRGVSQMTEQVRLADHLDDAEKMSIRTNMRSVYTFVFWGLHQLQGLKLQIESGGGEPDMRKLSAAISKLMEDAYLPTKQKQKKIKQKRQPEPEPEMAMGSLL